MPKLDELDLSKVQVVEAAPSANQPLTLDSIDLSKAEIIPAEQPELSGPTQGEAFLQGAQQGATLSFGDEIVAGLDSLVETVREKITGFSPLAPGKGIKDKYGAAVEAQRGKVKEAEQAYPLTTLGGKLVGGLPTSLATGGGGFARQVATTGAQGATTSLGESEKLNVEALKEAGKAGALSSLFNAGLMGATKLVKGVLKTPAGSFKISKELKEAASDPDVARKIGSQIDEVGENFSKLVYQTKDEIGPKLGQIAEKVKVPVNPESAFNNTVQKLNSFNPGRDAAAKAAKDDLLDAIQLYGENLGKASEGKLNSVSFKALHDAKEELGKEVFEQSRFGGNKYVDKVAKGLYREISDVLKKADPTKEYGEVSKVYQSLVSSDADAFSNSALRYLEDPFNLTARRQFLKVVGDLDSLSPALKAKYVQPIEDFIKNDFAKAALKQEVLKSVSGKTAPLLVKNIPLIEAIPGAVSSGAARAGAAYGKYVPQSIQQGVEKTIPSLSKGLGRAISSRVGPSLADQEEEGY